MSTRFLRMDEDNVQDAVIFDVDGVLADIRHRLLHCPGRPESAPDASWERYCALAHLDAPIPANLLLARMLYSSGFYVVLATNRNESERELLEAWLMVHEVRYDRLLMRAEGNHGDKQWVVDALHRQVRAVLALDDDRKHCATYEAAGIPALYVHSGYYDGITDDVYYSSHFVPGGGAGSAGYQEHYYGIPAVPTKVAHRNIVAFGESIDPVQYHAACGTTHNIVSGVCPPKIVRSPWD